MSSHSNDSDDLLAKAQSCDQAAENLLFEKLRARLLPLAKRRLRHGMHDPVKADDIVQDAVIVMLTPEPGSNKPQYKSNNHFWPWAFTILRNKIGNEIKRRKNLPLEDIVVDIGLFDDDAARAAWEKALDEKLQYILSQMSEKNRETISALISKSKGFDLPDHLAALPKSTWDPRVSRARKKLRRLMKREGLL